MKKEIIGILAILLLCGVFGMEDPITVSTSDGSHVKLYAWTAGGGPLLVMDEGDAANGSFSTTLYSLSEDLVRFHIIITNSAGEKIRDSKFDNQKINEPLMINCIPENCTIRVFNFSEQIIPEIVTLNNSENATELNQSKTDILFIGKSIFTNEDGSINYFTLGGIVGAILVLIILVFIFRKRKKNSVIVEKKDPEEMELEKLEGEVEKKAEELRKIKEINFRKLRIEEARKKLASEEKQIQIYRELNPEERMRRRRLEEAQRKLEEEERELKSAKENNTNNNSSSNSNSNQNSFYSERNFNFRNNQNRFNNNSNSNVYPYGRSEKIDRDSKSVKGFVDNMRRTAATEGDKKKPNNQPQN